MKKIITIAAIVAAAAVSTSASAFWGNNGSNNGFGSFPFNGMGDMFGMNEVNFSAKNSGRANGYGYGNPHGTYASQQAPAYYGYAPYGAPVAPIAPVAPVAPVAQ